ncbi:MAG: YhbY family RNA-binding protein, partial [Lachnospiraceae bacterium]|nr:YhbY family RNA-binding protein [Lachnospiraceae bacterium]
MTSKQRAYLRSLAMKEHAVVQVGKGGVTPDVTAYADEALSARELIKVDVLKNAG